MFKTCPANHDSSLPLPPSRPKIALVSGARTQTCCPLLNCNGTEIMAESIPGPISSCCYRNIIYNQVKPVIGVSLASNTDSEFVCSIKRNSVGTGHIVKVAARTETCLVEWYGVWNWAYRLSSTCGKKQSLCVT